MNFKQKSGQKKNFVQCIFAKKIGDFFRKIFDKKILFVQKYLTWILNKSIAKIKEFFQFIFTKL